MEQTNPTQGRGHPSHPSQLRRQSTGDVTHTQHPTAKKPIPTINPALFIPFSFIPPTTTAAPKTPEEHLQKLISNLLAQHETVKQNLITVTTARARKIRKVAQAELDALPKSARTEVPDLSKDEKFKQEVEETLRRMRVKPGPDAKIEDFEMKPLSAEQRRLSVSLERRRSSVSSDGVRKAFTFRENGQVVKVTRTAAVIRADTARKIRDLIDASVVEIEAYEKRAGEAVDYYRALLEHERLRIRSQNGNLNASGYGNTNGNGNPNERAFSGSNASSTTERPLPRGILINSYQASPVDRAALRRMSEDSWDGSHSRAQGQKSDELRREEARELARLEAEAMAMRDTIGARLGPEEVARLEASRLKRR